MGLMDRVLSKLKSNGGEKLDDIHDQTMDEIDLAQFVRKKVDETRAQSSRISHEGIWMTNVAYVKGFDSVYYDTQSRQFRVMGRTNQYLKRNRIHVNKILPTLQNRLARLCKNPPKFDVRPSSPSTDDKDAARLALQILTMLWDKERLNRKRIDLYNWCQQCGHGYIKVSWDDQMGNAMVDPATGELSGYEGDIRVDICSPFEIFPDPLAKTLDEATWVIQAKIRKLDYFKTHYPDRGHLVKEEGAWLLSAQYEARINSLNTQGFTDGNATYRMKGCAIELAYYERRSKKHPNGRMIVSSNGVLLEDKELPCGEMPFVKFDDILVAGSYYSESTVTHLRPIQDQFNRTIQKRAEWVNKLLTGKILAARGSGLQNESLNDQSGEVVYYDNVPNGGPPVAMQMPNIPAYAYNEDGVHEKNFNDISGISEVSRGNLPAAGIPAIGMQLLTEQDDTRIGIMTEAHEESWARVGHLLLIYAEECFEMPRILKIAGKNMEYTVKNFLGSDIKGNNDVIVIRGSTIPGSKTLRRQEILNTFSQGLLGNPQDPKVRSNVLSMLEYGDVAELWEDQALDEGQYQRCIDQIERGEMPQVDKMDNHPFFIQELNRYRKSEKFDSLDPQKKAILIATIQEHVQSIMALSDPSIETNQQMGSENPALKPGGETGVEPTSAPLPSDRLQHTLNERTGT